MTQWVHGARIWACCSVVVIVLSRILCAPLRCVPASQNPGSHPTRENRACWGTRACWEQLRASLRRKEGILLLACYHPTILITCDRRSCTRQLSVTSWYRRSESPNLSNFCGNKLKKKVYPRKLNRPATKFFPLVAQLSDAEVFCVAAYGAWDVAASAFYRHAAPPELRRGGVAGGLAIHR